MDSSSQFESCNNKGLFRTTTMFPRVQSSSLSTDESTEAIDPTETDSLLGSRILAEANTSSYDSTDEEEINQRGNTSLFSQRSSSSSLEDLREEKNKHVSSSSYQFLITTYFKGDPLIGRQNNPTTNNVVDSAGYVRVDSTSTTTSYFTNETFSTTYTHSNDEKEHAPKDDNDDSTESPRRRDVWQWALLYILIPTFWLKFCQRSTIPVIPVFVRSELEGNDQQLGLVLAAVGVGKLLTNLPSGQWVAVGGAANGMWGACLLLGLSWWMAATSPSVVWLGIAGLLEGWGRALWQVARQTVVTQEISRDEGRGKVQATAGGLERLASVVGPSLGGWIAVRYTLRTPFFAKSFLMLLAVPFFGILQQLGWAHRRITNTPREEDELCDPVTTKATAFTKQQEEEEELSPFQESLRSVLRTHGNNLQIISIWAMFMNIAREARLLLVPLRAMELGYGPHAIGILTSLTFVVDTAMFPLSGYITDTFGRKYSGVPSALLLALSCALAPSAQDLITLTLISALGGFGNGISGGVVTSVGSDLSPRHNRQQCALFLGVFRTVSDVGFLVAPLIGGTISQQFGLNAAFWTASFCSLVAALWMAFVLPETRWKERAATTATPFSKCCRACKPKETLNFTKPQHPQAPLIVMV